MQATRGLCKYFVTGGLLAFSSPGAMIGRADVLPFPFIMDTTTPPEAPATPVLVVPEEHTGNKGLFLIAVFELVKTVLFVVAAAGVFHLVNRDTQVELTKLLHAFRISGDSHFVKDMLLRANVITDPGKRILSGLLLLYAALHATEGVGLLLRKRWAEYITVVMTGIFIPYELYILIHHTTHARVPQLVPPDQKWMALFSQHIFVWKILVLIGNVGIVGYLVYHLRHNHPAKTASAGRDVAA